MSKQVLAVINAGSSSLKFALFDKATDESFSSGLCERIGIDGNFKISYLVDGKEEEFSTKADFSNHEKAIDFLVNTLLEKKIVSDLKDIVGIGHRIVQGGSIAQSSLIDEKVLAEIEKNIVLAPLHNKPEADVIRILMKKIPSAKNVAVFDTSFHTSIPKINSYYAIKKEWIEKYQIKKYGFHGTSYRYITEKACQITNKKSVNLVVCHLGNGASLCCVKNNQSYDTTMGFSPLTGLVMGTRTGDVDASIVDFLSENEKLDAKKIINSFNKESGLISICNNADFRDILAGMKPGNEFEFAFQIFSQKVANYIALFINMLEEKVDGIIFTGGIGENAFAVRSEIAKRVCGLKINEEANKAKVKDFSLISDKSSRYNMYVIRTNEELKIALDTKALIN